MITATLALHEKSGFIIANTYSPRLDAEGTRQIINELCNSKKVQVITFRIKSQMGRVFDDGLRTVIPITFNM